MPPSKNYTCTMSSVKWMLLAASTRTERFSGLPVQIDRDRDRER